MLSTAPSHAAAALVARLFRIVGVESNGFLQLVEGKRELGRSAPVAANAASACRWAMIVALRRSSGYAASLKPILSSSAGGKTGVSPPARQLAIWVRGGVHRSVSSVMNSTPSSRYALVVSGPPLLVPTRTHRAPCIDASIHAVVQ